MIGTMHRLLEIRGLSDHRDVIAAGSALVAIDLAVRLLPHAPSCTSVAASALFAGFLIRQRWAAMLVPVAAMLVSDLLIGTYDWRIMAVVCASIALPALAGPLGRPRHGAVILGVLAPAGSLQFFLASNAAVWLFSGMYTTDVDGLLRCYVAALPFFVNTVCGDLLWMLLFLTAFALARATAARISLLQVVRTA
jgi:hypothetical protein